jgi:glycerol-3-phosphate acyltransferase PlsY
MDMVFVAIILAIAVSYVMGSVPTGYLLVKYLKSIDIRTVGSGNIGATNVKRVLGMKWFFITLCLDALKGFLPVIIFGALFGAKYPGIPILAAAAAVLGHTFTIFLNFKGGKGVATALGVFIALAPMSVLSDAILFILVLWFFRYISLGSILCAFLLPIFIYIYAEGGYLGLTFIFSLAVAVFVIYKHKDNINRLAMGTENKFEFGKTGKAAQKEVKK